MKYEPSYDGVRACAVGGVIAVHCSIPLQGGGTGVEVFYALSGYLITRILLAEDQSFGTIDLKRFYYRRFLRLAPALLSVLIFVTAWAFITNDRVMEQLFSSAMSLFYVMNLNRAFEWGSDMRLGHTWSLSMEEQFYLVWPILFKLIPRNKLMPITMGLIVAVCAWRGYLLINGASVNRVYNGPDTHSETLLFGCLFALLEPRLSPAIKAFASKWIAVPIVAFMLEVAFLPVATPFGQGVATIGIALISGWLIVTLPQSTLPRAFLSSGPMVYLGRISYGLYLWHIPILSFGADAKIPHWSMVTPFLTLIVAAASFRWLEQPFLRLKDRQHPKH